MEKDAHILFERRGALGLITLNRPKALNALSRGMCMGLRKTLAAWADDAGVAAVVIRGAGGRAFCAGGDIRAMAESAAAGTKTAADFLAEEYRANVAVAEFPKPYIALWQGVVMGGGAGVSVHGGFRLGDHDLSFAMPETAIGFIPDVGSSYFLTHCPGATGMYLALTGARIGLGDACALGLATHALTADHYDALLERLARGEDAARVIAALAGPAPLSPMAEFRGQIDTIFAAPTLENILERLDRDGSAFATGTAAAIRARSPTAGKLTFALLRRARGLSLRDCLKMEYRVASRAVMAQDFQEGVRARLIERTATPAWNPPALAGVTEAAIEGYFAPLGARELAFARL